MAEILEFVRSVRKETQAQNETLKAEISQLEQIGPLRLYEITMAKVKQGDQERNRVEIALGNLQKCYGAEIKKHSDLEKENKTLEESIRKIQDKMKLKASGQWVPPPSPPPVVEAEVGIGGKGTGMLRKKVPTESSQAES